VSFACTIPKTEHSKLSSLLSVGGKMAEQYVKRKGGDPDFIGISAFHSIIGA